MANLDHRHRNKAMWKALTAEDNIDRTRGVLVNSYERARSTLANRRADREAFENERFSEGRRGRLEILRTQQGYDSWKLNTGNFIRHVASALAEVNQIQKEHNRAKVGPGLSTTDRCYVNSPWRSTCTAPAGRIPGRVATRTTVCCGASSTSSRSQTDPITPKLR